MAAARTRSFSPCGRRWRRSRRMRGRAAVRDCPGWRFALMSLCDPSSGPSGHLLPQGEKAPKSLPNPRFRGWLRGCVKKRADSPFSYPRRAPKYAFLSNPRPRFPTRTPCFGKGALLLSPRGAGHLPSDQHEGAPGAFPAPAFRASGRNRRPAGLPCFRRISVRHGRRVRNRRRLDGCLKRSHETARRPP